MPQLMKVIILLLFGAVLGVALLPYLLFRQKDMPPGTNLASPAYPFKNVELLVDRTAWDLPKERGVKKHHIFDAILDEIRAAESFLIADFFLWNPWKGAIGSNGSLRPLAEELADALIAKRQQDPEMPMLIITDPINRIYGDLAPDFYQRLTNARIPVVFTAQDQLPDSNKLYVPQVWFWSRFFDGNGADAKYLISNPFDSNGRKLTLKQLGKLLYFKANHRKVLVTGRQSGDLRLLMSSFNPADGSANHSNLGLLVDGPVAVFAAESELEVARWSASNAENIHGGLTEEVADAISDIQEKLLALPEAEYAKLGDACVAYRSERAIRDELVLQFQKAVTGTRIDIGMFYFSDRKVVEALKAAIEQGAIVRVLLDANRDAFGRKKNGIPNRTVAAELMELADEHEIEVRWAATNGEQFHSKVLRISGAQQEVLFLGSANWTRRNIGNLNLESNLLLSNVPSVNQQFDNYFSSVWSNAKGIEESLPYEALAETGWSLTWKTWLYRFQEWSGASTF